MNHKEVRLPPPGYAVVPRLEWHGHPDPELEGVVSLHLRIGATSLCVAGVVPSISDGKFFTIFHAQPFKEKRVVATPEEARQEILQWCAKHLPDLQVPEEVFFAYSCGFPSYYPPVTHG